MSVAVLFDEFVSFGVDTVTVFTNCAVADGLTAAITVYVTVPPTARLPIVSLIGPEPLLPSLPLHVSLVIPDGSVSLTNTLVAVLGPLLLTTTVYVKLVPGTTVPVLGVIDEPPLLSTFVTPTSTCGVRLSLSVAVLFDEFVSFGVDTVTVFTNCAVADGLTAAITVYVTVAAYRQAADRVVDRAQYFCCRRCRSTCRS